METHDQGFPGEFGQNSREQESERRFGEAAYAYDNNRDKARRQDRQGGMATSSALAGTGTTAGSDSAYGSPVEGTQRGGGIGPADRGAIGTVNTGSGAGLSFGNAAGGTAFADEPDAAWQRDRAAFQEHFTARHPAQGDATERYTWEQAEPNYRYGYEAARSGRYQGRRFEEIEPDLRRGYESQAHTSNRDQESAWDHLREEVREGFTRARQG